MRRWTRAPASSCQLLQFCGRVSAKKSTLASPRTIEVVGDQKTVRTLVKALVEKRFKETGLKTYARGADGKPTVTVLQAKTDAAELKKAVPAAS